MMSLGKRVNVGKYSIHSAHVGYFAFQEKKNSRNRQHIPENPDKNVKGI